MLNLLYLAIQENPLDRNTNEYLAGIFPLLAQYFIGMRNEANYGKEYIIASAADVDSVVSLIHNTWETNYFQAKVDTTKMTKMGARHINEMKIALDSLREIKAKNLAPTFK